MLMKRSSVENVRSWWALLFAQSLTDVLTTPVASFHFAAPVGPDGTVCTCVVPSKTWAALR
jgi:hypothetical protein